MSLVTLQDLGEIDHAALRAEVDDARRRLNVSANKLAGLMELAPSTMSEWLRGNYRGDNDGFAAKVRRGLDGLAERSKAEAARPKRAPFLITKTAERIEQSLQFAHYMPSITVVGMAPGVGKTMTCRKYRDATPNVYMITADPSTCSVSGLLGLLSDELGIGPMPLGRLSRHILDRLRGRNALLIVDETQHLGIAALDQLRSIHDQADCGVALVGNTTVSRRVEGGGRQAAFAQIFSRVFKSVTQTEALKADAEALIAWYGIQDRAAIRRLVAIAKKPGGLRGLTATILQAQMLAGGEPLTLDAIDAGYAQLSPTVIQGGA